MFLQNIKTYLFAKQKYIITHVNNQQAGEQRQRTVQVLTAILFHLTNTLTGQLIVTGAGPEVITSTTMHCLGVVLDGKKPIILQY